ncbi:hypothetical protein [Microbacterium sp. B35-04]|uniref:hypothetical protein n=1 Tax=Microbacterium sp. B35-04 TaxID=1961716 RepID=UPI0013D50857|nr:hypothetical protein [Microbacterium sp. B35-04]
MTQAKGALMPWMLIWVLVAPLVGVVLAVAWWLIRRRSLRPLGGAVAVFTVIAGTVGVLVEVSVRVLMAGPILAPFAPSADFAVWYLDYRFTIPVAVGIVGVALLAFPIRSRQGAGVAELAPRGPLRFTRPRWFISPAIVLALVLLITILSGTASQPNPDTGRYDMYLVDLGTGTTMGTYIYGWYYSLPALITILALVVAAVASLALIARPPLAADRDNDARIRRIRSLNVIVVVTASLVLHLGLIVESLARTASLAATVSSDVGQVTLTTPIVAMIPVFIVASYIAVVAGAGLFASVALTGVGARRNAPVMVDA